jgi:hypothetical protein
MTTVGSRKKDLEKGLAPPIRYNGREFARGLDGISFVNLPARTSS